MLGISIPECNSQSTCCIKRHAKPESLAEPEGLLSRESTGGGRVTSWKTWRGDEVDSDIKEVASDYTDIPLPAEDSHSCRQNKTTVGSAGQGTQRQRAQILSSRQITEASV